MRVLLVAAVAAILASGPACAVERTSDVEELKGYVDVCKNNKDERGVEGCIADQVSSKTSYLGDILVETAGELTPKQEKLLNAAQTAFAAYLEATCRYQVTRTLEDKRAQMFCVLRLTNQRIADVLEGVDFLKQD